MVSIKELIELVLHLDASLVSIVQQYGIWTYPLLFLIIFLETGIVITPFLPGDSLLFAAGAIAVIGNLNIIFLFVLIALAAIIGDAVNYWIGYHVGPRVFHKENSKLLNKEYLFKAERFYEKHGAKTIFLARFIPILRTFAPFVAGIGKMQFRRFAAYNVAGGLCWTGLFLFGGFYLGNVQFVKEHFSLFILFIIIVSLIPLAVEFVKNRK